SDVATSGNGVIVDATGVDNTLDTVVVKAFAGNGFVINGVGTDVITCEVEDVALDGFAVTGNATLLKNSSVTAARRGFVVSGANPLLDTNKVERVLGDPPAVPGDAFVVTGNCASLLSNKAQTNPGTGYVIRSSGLPAAAGAPLPPGCVSSPPFP